MFLQGRAMGAMAAMVLSGGALTSSSVAAPSNPNVLFIAVRPLLPPTHPTPHVPAPKYSLRTLGR